MLFSWSGRPARPRTQHDCHHDIKVKPEAATAVIEFLMMGAKTPETCRAVNKLQDNKLKNCCFWLVIYLNCNFSYLSTTKQKSKDIFLAALVLLFYTVHTIAVTAVVRHCATLQVPTERGASIVPILQVCEYSRSLLLTDPNYQTRCLNVLQWRNVGNKFDGNPCFNS